MPFLRLEAPSRLMMQSEPSSETFTSLTVRASTVTVSMTDGLAGSETQREQIRLHLYLRGREMDIILVFSREISRLTL